MGGLTRFFAGVGIFLAGAIVLAGLALLAAYSEAKPYIEREYPTQLYERHDDCDMPCMAPASADGFHVADHMNEVHFVVYAALDDASGPARITVIDPSGDVRYERLFTAESELGAATQDSAVWSGEPGEWRISRSYVGTMGSVSLESWGMGLPAGTL